MFPAALRGNPWSSRRGVFRLGGHVRPELCLLFFGDFPRGHRGRAERPAGGRAGAGPDKGQIFLHVTLLQMVKRIVPPISNEVITLVKDTSLARIISLQELICAGYAFLKGSHGYSGLMWPLFFTGVYYLVFNGVVTFLFGRLERSSSSSGEEGRTCRFWRSNILKSTSAGRTVLQRRHVLAGAGADAFHHRLVGRRQDDAAALPERAGDAGRRAHRRGGETCSSGGPSRAARRRAAKSCASAWCSRASTFSRSTRCWKTSRWRAGCWQRSVRITSEPKDSARA